MRQSLMSLQLCKGMPPTFENCLIFYIVLKTSLQGISYCQPSLTPNGKTKHIGYNGAMKFLPHLWGLCYGEWEKPSLGCW